MIDTYLKATNRDVLAAFCGFFVNVLTIAAGVPPSPEVHDAESGSTFPAEPGRGDPAFFYTCIRAPFAVPVGDGIELADPAEARTVVGVWG